MIIEIYLYKLKFKDTKMYYFLLKIVYNEYFQFKFWLNLLTNYKTKKESFILVLVWGILSKNLI